MNRIFHVTFNTWTDQKGGSKLVVSTYMMASMRSDRAAARYSVGHSILSRAENPFGPSKVDKFG